MKAYNDIEKKLLQEHSILKAKKSKLGNIRLIVFAISAFLFYLYLTSSNQLYLAISTLFFVALIILIIKTSKVSAQLEYATQAVSIVEQIKLNDTTDLFSEDNGLFENVYNKDLDILEGKSLFNRINKTQTRIGSLQLKTLLSELILEPEEIIQRQKAFTELETKREWIVRFLTLTKRLNISQSKLFTFEKQVFTQSKLLIIPLIFSLVNISCFTYLALIGFPKKLVFFWIVGAIAISFIIHFIFKQKLAQVAAYTSMKADELENLYDVLYHIETEKFETKLNQQIQQTFQQPHQASQLIKTISSSKETLDAANFPLIGFALNSFFLWRLYYSIQFEKEIQKTVTLIKPWLDELAKMEAFVSFAIFNDKFQSFHFPTLTQNTFQFELKNAYHPLLEEQIVVKNSFENHRANSIAIITGANMAGKSTFLRTVGTNLVLAMNGAKVSAEKMTFYPMDLFTSIRTVDNLSSGDSYFKNEINKLKILIDRISSDQPQFIILDEILKGTNSQDKLIGSQKFLEKLIQSPTKLVGFIATHDLELTKMEENFPEHIVNYCFELKNIKSQYFSDYILRKGTTQTMNALYLMRQFNIIDE